MDLDVFLPDLAVIFAIAVVAVLALSRIGLPPIVGFLVAGVLVGPGGFGWVEDPHQVEIMAELGVALLLFTIGLEFSLERLFRIWRYVALGGGMQVLFTIGGGILAAVLLDEPIKTGIFWGYLAALSSTAIVLSALSERMETSAPHGRFVIGVLIFQDLCIVPMMLTLPFLAGGGGSPLQLGGTLLGAAAVVAVVLGLARVVVPRVLHRVAATRRRELFLLSVLLLVVSVAWITSQMGLSLALGAFLAGVIIADTEFVHQAHSDVAPFRDALASLFFVSIGMLLDPRTLLDSPLAVAEVFLVLLGGKFVLAVLAGLLMRFPARVAILAGVGLAQVGEFSFVLLSSGREAGLIDAERAKILIASSVLTMAVAPVLMGVSPSIAAGAPLLRPLERLLAVRQEEESAAEPEDEHLEGHVIVAGLGVAGQLLIAALERVGVPYIAVELNPETVVRERKAGRKVAYGDISSADVLAHVADAGKARALVLLLSDPEASRRATVAVRKNYPDLHIIARAHRASRDEADLALLGAEVVSEDYETALEIVERTLSRVGVAGEVMRGAVRAVRERRTEHGSRRMPVDRLLGEVSLDSVTLAEGDGAVGLSVERTGLRATTGALIVALARGDGLRTAPAPDTVLLAGDTLFLFGTRDQIDDGVAHLRG